MVYKEDIVDIDVKKRFLIRSMGAKVLCYADSSGDKIGMRIYEDGVAADLTGLSCQGYFIRSHGDTVAITGEVSGNMAYVILPASCYVYEGQFSLAVKIAGTNTAGTMRIIDGIVVKTQTDTVIDPGSVIPSLSELLERIAAMDSATIAANAAADRALLAEAIIEGQASAELVALIEDISDNMIKTSAQELTDAKKTQARANIDAAETIKDITSDYTIQSSYGTISQKSAYKAGQFVTIAFVLTLTEALTGGTSYNIANMTQAQVGTIPIQRSQIGGSNLPCSNMMIDGNLKFYFTPTNNVANGTAFWLHYQFVCAN